MSDWTFLEDQDTLRSSETMNTAGIQPTPSTWRKSLKKAVGPFLLGAFWLLVVSAALSHFFDWPWWLTCLTALATGPIYAFILAAFVRWFERTIDRH